jgi:16S rRNA (cytosine967-C5)-methyltransferase
MASKMGVLSMANTGNKRSNPLEIKAREAAFLSVLNSLQEEKFANETLEKWKKEASPSSIDYHLAQEIAYGAIRMALSLDYIAVQLTSQRKLSTKLSERALLRSALYQACFMDRLPLYAIVNETVSIARKYFHESFAKFLNAILRKLSEFRPRLPMERNASDMSVRHSYPLFYIQELIHDYGIDQAENILHLGNQPALTMFRIRPEETFTSMESVEILVDSKVPFGIIRDSSLVSKISESKKYYIQNATPAALINTLHQGIKDPKHILDLCASPGGKLIAVHDYFPRATLTANDVSKKKVKILEQNCKKYSIEALLTYSPGETFVSSKFFDIVILDVPCSNTGVLNKRPEARWRLSEEKLRNLQELQWSLLKNACSLLNDQGEIWYLTCSILKRENELLMNKACKELSLKIKKQQTILPNIKGWDGGFACAMQKNV